MSTSDQALRDMGLDPERVAAFKADRARRNEEFHKIKWSLEDGAKRIHVQRGHVGSFETCDECRADLSHKVEEARDRIVHQGRFEGPEKSRERRIKAKEERLRRHRREVE